MDTAGEANNASGLSHPTGRDVCMRCGGLMVIAHCVDLQGYGGEVISKGLRCTNCGEFIDQTVLMNRLKLRPESLDAPKARTVAQQVSPKRFRTGK